MSNNVSINSVHVHLGVETICWWSKRKPLSLTASPHSHPVDDRMFSFLIVYNSIHLAMQYIFRKSEVHTLKDPRLHDSPRESSSDKPILPSSIILAPITWEFMNEIQQAQDSEPSPEGCPTDRVYVPRDLRGQLIQWIHSTPSSGHPGILRTITLVRNWFWWPSDVSSYVKCCSVCSQTKDSILPPAGLLQPLTIPHRPWSHIAVDFITDLPLSRDNTVILTIIDRFSKACRLIPLPKLPTAMETAENLFHYVFRFFGIPVEIVSDQGPQFISRVWKEFCRLLDIKMCLTSGYHPQSNGQVERLTQEVGRFLRSYCHNNQYEWSRYLPWAEYAQNSLINSSTGMTPFCCMLGYQPPLFPWSGEPSEVLSVDSLSRAIRRQKIQADRHRRPTPILHPGQRVWLSTRDLQLRLPCRKLSPRYVGPFPRQNKSCHLQTQTACLLSYFSHFSYFPSKTGLSWERRGVVKQSTTPTHQTWWCGGILGQGTVGLKTQRQNHPVSGGLGGIWPRGTLLGCYRWHPGPLTNIWFNIWNCISFTA